ncbi:hypothetical protein ED92_01880 [Amycolatopsis sp. MJM2582]|nr:hypothetical protein ED92_01880 [Amycolatopsis sp. MJM2582]
MARLNEETAAQDLGSCFRDRVEILPLAENSARDRGASFGTLVQFVGQRFRRTPATLDGFDEKASDGFDRSQASASVRGRANEWSEGYAFVGSCFRQTMGSLDGHELSAADFVFMRNENVNVLVRR